MHNISQTLSILQFIVGVILVVSILAQNKGVGLSNVFGGGSGAIYRTKRGFEKYLFYTTIILAIIFVGLSIANIFVAKS